MSKHILVVNGGSSSIKFSVFDLNTSDLALAVLYRGTLDYSAGKVAMTVDVYSPGGGSSEVSVQAEKSLLDVTIDPAEVLLDWLRSKDLAGSIDAICHRVVHGGDRYTRSVIVTEQVIEKLETLRPFAPLHQPKGLLLLYKLKEAFSHSLHVACFDTAFHQTMPAVARRLAIPAELDALGVKSYGFHGLSYQFIATSLHDYFYRHQLKRVIVLHLGSGASICALQDGVSVATTMTFSPLDGLPMATRSGSIDAGAVLYMASELNMTADVISTLLNKKSGLLGLSGISGDSRELLENSSSDAAFALEHFVYHICRQIGALAAVLQGVDALVFTGGIGFHSATIRQAVSDKLGWLGVEVDQQKNAANDFKISTVKSRVEVLVKKTDEEIMMAKSSLKLIATEKAIQ